LPPYNILVTTLTIVLNNYGPVIQGANVPGNERSQERKFQGTNGPENQSSIMGTYAPGNK